MTEDQGPPETVRRVAVVVFASVSTRYADDATSLVESAVRLALGEKEPDMRGARLPAVIRDEHHPDPYWSERDITVVEVRDLGTAARNGYVWVEPTSYAYRHLERPDG